MGACETYNLSILDFKYPKAEKILAVCELIIYPYWILNSPFRRIGVAVTPLIIYPYWILNLVGHLKYFFAYYL